MMMHIGYMGRASFLLIRALSKDSNIQHSTNGLAMVEGKEKKTMHKEMHKIAGLL